MTEEEGQQKIDTILGTIKEKVDYPDIPVRMWIVAETGKPGEPEFGFLYPAFKERGAAMNFVNIFEKNPARVHRELGAWMLQG